MSALLAVLVLAAAPWAEGGESRPEDLRISLVTFSPGDSLTELWGHTSLVVEDARLNHARLYNYGMFGFSDGFVHRFAQGRLEFWVADDPVQPTFDFYKNHLNRDVRIQELQLTPSEALEVARALAKNVEPAHRMYLYHHYNDNCSTRPRDILDAAIKGQLKAATAGPARMSLREHTRRYSMVSPPISVMLDYLQNDELEQPITQQQEAFLPDELERQVDTLQVTHDDGTRSPLVKRSWVYYQSPRARPPPSAPDWVPHLLGLSVAFGLVALGLGHWGRKGAKLPRVLLGLQVTLLGLVGGIFGLVLLFFATVTDHAVTHRNENLLSGSPVLIAAVPLGVMLMLGKARAPVLLRKLFMFVTGMALLGVVLKVLPAFNQANANILALTLPVYVCLTAVFWLATKRVD